MTSLIPKVVLYWPFPPAEASQQPSPEGNRSILICGKVRILHTYDQKKATHVPSLVTILYVPLG
jgi:hypothetical protein